MNKQRRAALAKALPLLEQAAALMAQAKAQIETVRDDEREAYEALSDGARDGDAGSAMDQALSDLDDAVDGMDGIDLAAVVRSVADVADRAVPEVAPARLTADQLDERRMARLAPWAREKLARAAAETKAAQAELAGAFRDADPENRRQIVVDDYLSAVRGKVIPSDQVAFPAQKLRVSVARDDDRAVEIHGLDMGSLCIMPHASNTVRVRVERLFG